MKQNTQTKNAEPVEGFTGGDWSVGYGIESNSLGIFTKKMLDEGIEEPPICLISPFDKITETDRANAALIAESKNMYKKLKWLDDYCLQVINRKLLGEEIDLETILDAIRNVAKAILNRINNHK